MTIEKAIERITLDATKWRAGEYLNWSSIIVRLLTSAEGSCQQKLIDCRAALMGDRNAIRRCAERYVEGVA